MLLLRVSNLLAEQGCGWGHVGAEQRLGRMKWSPWAAELLRAELCSQAVADAELLEHPKSAAKCKPRG